MKYNRKATISNYRGEVGEWVYKSKLTSFFPSHNYFSLTVLTHVDLLSKIFVHLPVRNVGELRSVVKTKIIVLAENNSRHPTLIVSEPHEPPGDITGSVFIG